jgi:hypothetical protein
MDEFILLVRHSYQIKQVLLPAHFGPPLRRWQEWVNRLKADGSLVTLPTHLDKMGRILTKGQAVAEGPYVEAGEVLDDLLLIKAADYEAATKVAQGCPVLAMGGTVEVRRAL